MSVDGSIAANPDGREFYDRPAATITDPADDLPGTVRVLAPHDDQRARLFDRDALRAVKTDESVWLLFAGDTDDVGEERLDDDVRGWAVVPAVFVSVPWSSTANHGPTITDHLATRHERGDMDAEAFRGDRRE